MLAGVRPQDNPTDVPDKNPSVLRRTLPVLLTLVAGLICNAMFYNRGLGLSVIGYSLAPSERVLQGEVPYRDFLFNYTPGILWVNALLMKTFGATLLITRIGLFGFKLITLLLLYYISRRLSGRWVALVPVALALAWPGYQQLFNPYPDQYLIPFALVGLICMLNYDDTEQTKWLVFCGLSTGVVLVFKHNVGVLLLVSGTIAIVMREMMTTRAVARAIKRIAIYGMGFMVVAGALLAYLIYTHAFVAMVAHFLHHAAEYSEARSVGLPSPVALVPVAIVLIPVTAIGIAVALFTSGRILHFYLIAMIVVVSLLLNEDRGKVLNESALALVAYIPPLIFLASTALGVWSFRKTSEGSAHWWKQNRAITITGLFALAIYLEVFPRADYYHLVRVLPPVFMFLFILLLRVVPYLTQLLKVRMASPRQAALLVVSAPIILLVVVGVHNTWEPQFDAEGLSDRRELTIERGRGILVEDKQAELAEGLVKLIQDNSSRDDFIFSFAQRGSGFYFLAERRNPTRFLWWRSVGIGSEERESVMMMIRDRRAKLIIVQDISSNKEILDFIAENYVHIGTVADIAVYGLRNPVSDAAINKLTVN